MDAAEQVGIRRGVETRVDLQRCRSFPAQESLDDGVGMGRSTRRGAGRPQLRGKPDAIAVPRPRGGHLRAV